MDESSEIREASMGELAFGVSEAGHDCVWWAGGAFGPLVPRLRRSAVAAAALDGVVAGSLALMAVVAMQLAKAANVDWKTLVVFGVSLIGLLGFRVNSAWVVAAAAIVGSVMR